MRGGNDRRSESGVSGVDSTIDKLTGLLKKDEFESRLEHEVQRAKRYHRPLTLLVVEVDWEHFEKQVSLRTAMPYTIFKQLGPLILRKLRAVDFAGRIAGETFSAMLPETPIDGAFIAADRLREAVEHYGFIGDELDRRFRVAVNIGVASFPEHGKETEELVTTANKALIMCREQGGNKTVLYPDTLYKASEVFWLPSRPTTDAGSPVADAEMPAPAPPGGQD